MSYSSSGFNSYGGGSGSGSGSAQDKGRLMEQVRNQIAVASAQELIQKMSDKCFRKCIYYPGSELDSKEQVRAAKEKCLGMCMDRYMEAWNITSKTYNERLQKERHSLK